jgi:hypothetical protein
MKYRKRKTVAYDTWHFCTNCSNWPTSDYTERTDAPTSGELCDQCKSKRDKKDCKTA